jgi:hypothetical protein
MSVPGKEGSRAAREHTRVNDRSKRRHHLVRNVYAQGLKQNNGNRAG